MGIPCSSLTTPSGRPLRVADVEHVISIPGGKLSSNPRALGLPRGETGARAPNPSTLPLSRGTPASMPPSGCACPWGPLQRGWLRPPQPQLRTVPASGQEAGVQLSPQRPPSSGPPQTLTCSLIQPGSKTKVAGRYGEALDSPLPLSPASRGLLAGPSAPAPQRCPSPSTPDPQ